MPYAKNKGMKVYFEEKGSGIPIILSPSFYCSTKMWETQFEVLSQSYRVINVDNRGHGKSAHIETSFTIYDMVEDLIAVLDSLEIESAVWGGLSIGGMISIRAYLKHPERVLGLILADTDADKESAINKLKYNALAIFGKLIINNMDVFYGYPQKFLLFNIAKAMFGKTTLKENMNLVKFWKEEFSKADFRSMLEVINTLNTRDSVLEYLPKIKIPTLIFAGEEDTALPLDRSKRIHEGIVGSTFVTIPKCGHLSSLEKSEEVTKLMLNFLKTFPKK